MINTSYVPLDQPYRIIEYNGTLGIQIGTLIVTRELEKEKYSIETHSHPVVSYVNNSKHKVTEKKKPIISVQYYAVEGVVWDKVEIGQVNSMGRLGERMRWEDFMDFSMMLKKKEMKKEALSATIKIVDAWNKLNDWGVNIVLPPIDALHTMRVDVELCDLVEGVKAYCYGRGGLGLITASVGVEKMAASIIGQVVIFESIMKYLHHEVKIIPHFYTKEERYQKLAIRLNSFYEESLEEDTGCLMAAEPSFEESDK